MALLYWQLGWEVGVVKRCLKENDINWGYFFDHNPFEPHCNAHPNNFVVLPPVSCVCVPRSVCVQASMRGTLANNIPHSIAVGKGISRGWRKLQFHSIFHQVVKDIKEWPQFW